MFKKVLLAVVLVLVVVFGAGFWYLNNVLPNAPEPENITVELTTERIQRGNYLANHVSVCMDCHAVRDWSFFSAPPFSETLGAGGDKFTREMGLPVNVYAKNLTPTNLSQYTDGELFRAITTGVDRHNDVLFPIMPIAYYSGMTDEDLSAIYTYLQSLEPIHNPVVKFTGPAVSEDS